MCYITDIVKTDWRFPVRRKCFVMAIVSFAIALAIYAFTYYLYHYLGDGGNFGTVYHTDPVKPLVTVYFGIWGVMHQFAALTSFVAGLIFFPKEKRK